MSSPAFGSLKTVLDAPPNDLAPIDSWVSVFFMWLFFPFNLLFGALAALSPKRLRGLALKAKSSSEKGRPVVDSALWWRYNIAGLIALLKNRSSRFALFMYQFQAFGSRGFYWQLQGVWVCLWKDVDSILRGSQRRDRGFAAGTAVTPGIFPPRLLLFLSNGPGQNPPDSWPAEARDPSAPSPDEWFTYRVVLHKLFLGQGPLYSERVGALAGKLRADWRKKGTASPSRADLSDENLLVRHVCKSVFWVSLGIWVDDAEADHLAGWYASRAYFVLPRLLQRFVFNFLIGRVKKLRQGTVDIVKKHKLEGLFAEANAMLGQWKRDQTVEVADEILFGLGFAGIIGTATATVAVGKFLEGKTSDVPADSVKFDRGPDGLMTLYRNDPYRFIQEVCRLDPPVTSACSIVKANFVAPEVGTVVVGSYQQYVVSIANRDPEVFPDPNLFDPTRPNLSKSLSWNGQAFGADESQYPRICPGRYLSRDIIRIIVGIALGVHPSP